MSAFVVDAAATIACPHGGSAQPTPMCTRVAVDGKQPLLVSDDIAISGCTFNVSGSPSPCLRITWFLTSTRVTFESKSVVLSSSIGLCLNVGGIPQGIANVSGFQTKVQAT